MRRYWNNKGRIIFRSKLFALSSLLLALCLILPDNTSSGPYLDSAHGNYTPSPGYGVLRTSLSTPPNDYGRGNCVHCHEQHASIGGSEPDPIDGTPSKYELFTSLFGGDQATGVFCYACHKDPIDSNQISMPDQWNYSRMAGGDTTIACPSNIKEAFKFYDALCVQKISNYCGYTTLTGSAHCLDDIQKFLTYKGSTWNFSTTEEHNNPCSGCHNPHRAQYDPHTSTGRIVDGKLVSSVSLPSLHSKDNNAWQLWGDESGERMSDYAGAVPYKAPCRYPQASCNSTTGPFEPDGSSTSDGSNLVDYVTFCLKCHKTDMNGIVGIKLPRNAIDWGTNVHGKRGRTVNCDWGGASLTAPYDNAVANYVLSCTDCHEPHGSRNEWLLRVSVNGKSPLKIQGRGLWYNWCQGCHTQAACEHEGGVTTNCWSNGTCHAHGVDSCAQGNL